MSKAKHSPAPWRYDAYWEGGGKHIIDSKNQLVSCHGFAAASGKTPKQRNANGNVMTAAPELLEALKYAVKCVKYCHAKHPDIQKGDGVPVYLLWEELIARAESNA